MHGHIGAKGLFEPAPVLGHVTFKVIENRFLYQIIVAHGVTLLVVVLQMHRQKMHRFIEVRRRR